MSGSRRSGKQLESPCILRGSKNASTPGARRMAPCASSALARVILPAPASVERSLARDAALLTVCSSCRSKHSIATGMARRAARMRGFASDRVF